MKADAAQGRTAAAVAALQARRVVAWAAAAVVEGPAAASRAWGDYTQGMGGLSGSRVGGEERERAHAPTLAPRCFFFFSAQLALTHTLPPLSHTRTWTRAGTKPRRRREVASIF